MNVYDRLEKAGHDVVLVNGLSAGVSTYVCENCGALFKLRNDEVILFHAHPASAASESSCQHSPPTPSIHRTLREKVKKLEDDNMETFRRAMED